MVKVLSKIRIRQDVCNCGRPFDRVGMDLTGATYFCKMGHWIRIEYGETPPVWKDPRLTVEDSRQPTNMEGSPAALIKGERVFSATLRRIYPDGSSTLGVRILVHTTGQECRRCGRATSHDGYRGILELSDGPDGPSNVEMPTAEILCIHCASKT